MQKLGWKTIDQKVKLKVKAKNRDVNKTVQLKEGTELYFDTDKVIKIHGNGSPTDGFTYKNINTSIYNN